jgi:hypothetical protein
VTHSTQKRLEEREKSIAVRLGRRGSEEQREPHFKGGNIRYELADRARGLSNGGIGVIQQLVRRVGLAEEINRRLPLLERHIPYWESDHVLNMAYNILCGGTCLEDLELLRNNEVYLDALGSARIPDPTTAGDFCRRFTEPDVDQLMDIFNSVRLKVWAEQDAAFFKLAVIDADGTLAPTTGEKKEGMDISYKGVWCYHPLVVSLANTGEPLYLVNRSGNRPSHEGAAERLDQAIRLCRQAGFKRVRLRGDTDFSQTAHLDRWDDDEVEFIFGIDANANLKKLAEALPESSWNKLTRPAKYQVKTAPREKRANVKEQIVKEREFKNIRLVEEEVAEFDYKPAACKKVYRVVALRKNLTVERGEQALFDDIRYFFYITNARSQKQEQVVREANERCNQENLIEQLKNGVHALRMPEHTLVSNWAYAVIASLAWSLKAWYALLLSAAEAPSKQDRADKRTVLRMEFKTFLNAFIRMPAQVIRTGGRLVFRLLAWNPWQRVFLRAAEAQRKPLLC